jgi:hypothetical protein
VPEDSPEGRSDLDVARSTDGVISVLPPDLTIVEMLQGDDVSTRLRNILRNPAVGSLAVVDYLRRRGRIEEVLLRQPNCGRRSVQELRVKVATRLFGALVQSGLPEDRAEELATGILGASPETAAALQMPPSDGELSGLVEWYLERLPERDAVVLRRRFGLSGYSGEVLEQIGLDMKITRERVRQIEAKGLRRVREHSQRNGLRETLDRGRAAAHESLFGGALHVSAMELAAACDALPAPVLFSMKVLNLSPPDWLSAGLTEFESGWLRSDVAEARIQALSAQLESWSDAMPFPRSVASFGKIADLRETVAAIELGVGLHVQEGYAFRRRPGRRALRTVRLHAILRTLDRPMSMPALLALYTDAVPESRCTERDLLIVLEAATHLFIELEEGEWSALGHAGALPQNSGSSIAPPALPDEDDGTVATALERALEQGGPSRVSSLIEKALDILPRGRSPNSVGPTLLMNPCRFVRILPGVYGLPKHVFETREIVSAEQMDYLLNAQQARIYALGRFAGEKWGTYPLWTAAVEMRLCRWARRAGETELLRSLLSVSQIDAWPTDAADRDVWKELRRQEARFELNFDPPLLTQIPEPDRVLAASLRLRAEGTIGFVTANRIMKYKAYSPVASRLLSGMVRAGIAEASSEPYAWQRPHHPGSRLDFWTEILANALAESGQLRWDDVSLAELAPAFMGDQPLHAPGNSVQDADDELDELESLLAEHRKTMRLRSLEDQLDQMDANE